LKKILITLPLLAIVFSSCAQKEDLLTLQDKVIKLEKEIKQLKRTDMTIEQNIENLSERIDKLSEITANNSKQIELLKKKQMLQNSQK
jgi:uncharacterized protein YlxW (UPF0749 family)